MASCATILVRREGEGLATLQRALPGHNVASDGLALGLETLGCDAAHHGDDFSLDVEGFIEDDEAAPSVPLDISLKDDDSMHSGTEVVYLQDNVAVWPSTRHCILGRLTLIKQCGVTFVAWLPYSRSVSTSSLPTGTTKAAAEANKKLTFAERARYAVHPIPLSEVRAIRCQTPLLLVSSVVLILRDGLCLPPLYFHAGGLRQLLAYLKKHLDLAPAAGQKGVFFVYDTAEPLPRTLATSAALEEVIGMFSVDSVDALIGLDRDRPAGSSSSSSGGGGRRSANGGGHSSQDTLAAGTSGSHHNGASGTSASTSQGRSGFPLSASVGGKAGGAAVGIVKGGSASPGPDPGPGSAIGLLGFGQVAARSGLSLEAEGKTEAGFETVGGEQEELSAEMEPLQGGDATDGRSTPWARWLKGVQRRVRAAAAAVASTAAADYASWQEALAEADAAATAYYSNLDFETPGAAIAAAVAAAAVEGSISDRDGPREAGASGTRGSGQPATGEAGASGTRGSGQPATAAAVHIHNLKGGAAHRRSMLEEDDLDTAGEAAPLLGGSARALGDMKGLEGSAQATEASSLAPAADDEQGHRGTRGRDRDSDEAESFGSASVASVDGFELVSVNAGTGRLLLQSPRVQLPPLSADEWQALFDQGRLADLDTLRRRVYESGVDPGVRPEVWKYLLGLYPAGSSQQERDELLRKRRKDYQALRMQWESISPEQASRNDQWRERCTRVNKDARRTDRHLPFFALERGPNVAALRRILLTYAVYNFNLGYCQGMSDLASPLLYILCDEVEAFWCFVLLLERMGSHFDEGQTGVQAQLRALGQLLQALDPLLHAHLESLEALSYFFCFRWLLVLFKREFKFEEVLRLWEAAWACPFSGHLPVYLAAAVLVHHRRDILENTHDLDDLLRLCCQLQGKLQLEPLLVLAQRMAGFSAAAGVGIERTSGLPVPPPLAAAEASAASAARRGGARGE